MSFFFIRSCLAICLQASAHLKQVSAHCLQWSCGCFSHSFPQASQIFAHTDASSAINGVPLVIACSKYPQISAHSLSNRMHSAKIGRASCRERVEIEADDEYVDSETKASD